jgi:hypothetical protein
MPNIPRCDVGVDVWDFAPVSWEAVRLKLGVRKRQFSGDVGDLDANMVENIRANREISRRLAEPHGTEGGPLS